MLAPHNHFHDTGVTTIGKVVGFVGAGVMGRPMIACLSKAGFKILVYDRDPMSTSKLTELHGVSVAASISDVASASIAVCMLPNSLAVQEVMTGHDGLLHQSMPPALVVDMGSSEPSSTVALAKEAAAAGVGFVDAPVSGGVSRARLGKLTIMFGGSDRQLELTRPVLESLGDTIIHMGSVGSGHAMKALNNLLSAVNLSVSTEAIEVGRRFGLDPEAMVKVLNQSTGRNHATETKLREYIIPANYSSGFSLQLMLKDLRTALTLAREQGVAVPIADACLELWEQAASVLPSDADQTQIALLPMGQRLTRQEPVSEPSP